MVLQKCADIFIFCGYMNADVNTTYPVQNKNSARAKVQKI